MEEILSKLSEIETTAQSILEDADSRKKALSMEMDQKCKDFDSALEKSMDDQIGDIRKNLESEKDSRLTELRASTEKAYQQLDAYYEKNHQRLSEEIFKQIIA